jgi:hypothetical protein
MTITHELTMGNFDRPKSKGECSHHADDTITQVAFCRHLSPVTEHLEPPLIGWHRLEIAEAVYINQHQVRVSQSTTNQREWRGASISFLQQLLGPCFKPCLCLSIQKTVRHCFYRQQGICRFIAALSGTFLAIWLKPGKDFAFEDIRAQSPNNQSMLDLQSMDKMGTDRGLILFPQFSRFLAL